MTESERSKAVAYLKETRDRFQRTLAGLRDQQLTFRTALDRWSVADCAEHLAEAESGIIDRLEELVADPNSGEGLKFKRRNDWIIKWFMPSRLVKVPSPDNLRPDQSWDSPTEPVSAFLEKRARTIEFAETTQADVRRTGFAHMAFGDLDIYQWLVLAAAHSERHLKQIDKVIADKRFPVGRTTSD